MARFDRPGSDALVLPTIGPQPGLRSRIFLGQYGIGMKHLKVVIEPLSGSLGSPRGRGGKLKTHHSSQEDLLLQQNHQPLGGMRFSNGFRNALELLKGLFRNVWRTTNETIAASHQMPMKVYDAMAMGCPIVATAVSDLPQVLEGCARLVPLAMSMPWPAPSASFSTVRRRPAVWEIEPVPATSKSTACDRSLML